MLGKFLAFVLGIAGLLIGSQAPNFTNNFMQNLEGRVDERSLDFERITERWEYFGTDRANVADDCRANSTDNTNPEASCLEDVLIVERFESLTALKTELNDATIWERPILLIKAIATERCNMGADVELAPASVDNLSKLCMRDLAVSTGEAYEPAIPVTADGAAYAAGGGLGFWAIFRLLFGVIGLPFRPRYA